jgi:predicted methyltransferase
LILEVPNSCSRLCVGLGFGMVNCENEGAEVISINKAIKSFLIV